MEYQVIWSEEAIDQLQAICSHIAKDNADAAVRLGEGILAHTRILATFPFIGPAYPRGARGPLREIVYRPYRIFYDVFEDPRSVHILHVRHGAREEPKL